MNNQQATDTATGKTVAQTAEETYVRGRKVSQVREADLRIITAPFKDGQKFRAGDIVALPYPTPEGITFADGQAITAYRANVRLTAPRGDHDKEPIRINALRVGNALFIFAPSGEDATAAATLTTARVHDGCSLTEESGTTGSAVTAYIRQFNEGGAQL